MRMRVMFIMLIMGLSKIGWSESFQVVGTRAKGMGGAFVAVVDDATASYWNPAAFGAMMETSRSKKGRPIPTWDFDLQVPFGVQFASHENILKEADDLRDIDFERITDHAEEGSLTPQDVQQFLRLMRELDDLNKEGLGIQTNVNLGGHLRVRNFGFSVLALGSVGADPDIDLKNISLEGGGKGAIDALVGAGNDHSGDPDWGPEWEGIANKIEGISGWNDAKADELVYRAKQAGLSPSEADKYCVLVATIASMGGGKLEDNQSHLTIQGGLIQEYTFTYGYPKPVLLKNLFIGGNLKFIKGDTIFIDRTVFEDGDENAFEDILDETRESSTNFGLDVGLLYKLPKFKAGLVARNLNSPRFNLKGEGDYVLEPQIRLGRGYLPLNWLTLSLDLDLTQNPTLLKDYNSQNIALGVEAWIFRIFALRGGLYKNMAEDDIGSVYTAGLGLRVWRLHLDLAGAMGSERVRIGLDGIEIAKEYAFSGTLSWNQRF